MKKTLIIVGIAILALSIGISSATGFGFTNHNEHYKKFIEGSNFTHDKISNFHKSFNKTSITEKLGLPEDATITEIHNTMKENKESEKTEWLIRVKQKLGLPEDATDDELKEAISQWKEENKDLLKSFTHGKRIWHGNSFKIKSWHPTLTV